MNPDLLRVRAEVRAEVTAETPPELYRRHFGRALVADVARQYELHAGPDDVRWTVGEPDHRGLIAVRAEWWPSLRRGWLSRVGDRLSMEPPLDVDEAPLTLTLATLDYPRAMYMPDGILPTAATARRDYRWAGIHRGSGLHVFDWLRTGVVR